MVAFVIPFFALLLSFFILLLGSGLQGILLPVRGTIEAFSPIAVGMLGASYYVGYGAGCLFGPHVVKRVGHIRAFAVFCTIASAIALAHALIVEPWAWWGFRLLTGICFAGLYMIIESWLNERADAENRGQLLSVYQVVNLGALTLGQLLLNLADPSGFDLFAVSSILASLALVPVALTRATAPAPIEMVRIRLRWVYEISPVGVVGCLAVGLVNGAIYTLAPVYAQLTLPTTALVAAFMALIIVGGAVFQWPLGRASDRVDRRWVIIAICLGGAVMGLALALFPDLSGKASMVLAFLYGGFTFSLYAVVIAHANDSAGPQDFVDISSSLLLIFAGGAVVGPLLAALAMSVGGPGALFGFSAIVHALAAGFSFYRTKVHAAVPEEDKDEFVHVPRTTPAVFQIDPRSPEEGEGGESTAPAPETEGAPPSAIDVLPPNTDNGSP